MGTRLPPSRGKLSPVRVTDEGGDKGRRTSQDCPLICLACGRAPLPPLAFSHFPIPSVSLCSTSPLDKGSRPPPCGGKTFGLLNLGGIRRFVGRLDTFIGNWGGVRLLGGRAARVYRSYKGGGGSLPPHPALRATFPPRGRLFGGTPSFAPKGEGFRAADSRPYRRGNGNLTPHPPQCAHWDTFPPGGRLRGRWEPRPYTTFTNGSIYKKRDRSGTCPLKRRGETQFRIKFLCLLSFSKKVGAKRSFAGNFFGSFLFQRKELPYSFSMSIIRPTRRAWRPPSNWVFRNTSTMRSAMLGPMIPAPMASMLASLWRRVISAE